MTFVNRDLTNTGIVLGGRFLSNYNRIYFHSNEDLRQLFSNIDVNNKDVLSVLASGDQVFHLYDRGSRHIDLFDINKLTVYYFYLRMWIIKYLNCFYPPLYIDNNYICRLLKIVRPNGYEEHEAFEYWTKFIRKYNLNNRTQFFIYGNCPGMNDICDFSTIKDKLENDKRRFFNIDISKNAFKIKNKYDLIYTSNLSECINYSVDTFIKYRNNIERLLKDNGLVLSVNKRLSEIDKLEREFLRRNLVWR